MTHQVLSMKQSQIIERYGII